jgi:hypothetical protein
MEKIRIRFRDKHPGSATLMDPLYFGQLDIRIRILEQPDPDLIQRDPRPTKKILLGWVVDGSGSAGPVCGSKSTEKSCGSDQIQIRIRKTDNKNY